MRRRSRLPAIALVLTAALALAACSRDAVYSRFLAMGGDGWAQDDSLVLDMAPLATAGVYTPVVSLRTSSAYPFTSITVIVGLRSSLSHIERSDTVEIALTDDDGKTLGRGVGLLGYSHALQPLTLAEGDSLHVSLRHFMRRTPLEGVADVGITLDGSARRRSAGR